MGASSLTVVRGTVREIGRTTTTQVSAQRWYGSTKIVVQDETSRKTYDVIISSYVMDKCRFLPRVGMRVIIHGYVEEAESGLSDYVVTRVTHIKHEGAGILDVHRFDEE